MAVAVLGHYSFEIQFTHTTEQVRAIAFHVIGIENRRGLDAVKQPTQLLLAINQRQKSEILIATPENIEGHENQRATSLQ